MICQATYDSLEAIPENLRDEFEQKNGKWQLKDSAIPGVGPLFNAAIAANADKAVGQVKARNERITKLEEELNSTKDRLAVLDSPGNKVLSKEDSELWEKYVKLGTPKEIESKVAQHEELAAKAQKAEAAELVGKIAKAVGASGTQINTEVLSDWVNSPDAKNLTLFTKSVEQTDAKGNKLTVEVPYVRIETAEDGKTKVSEKEFLPYAKETFPAWKYNALTTPVEGQSTTNGGVVSTKPTAGGVRIPDLNSARKAPTGGGEAKRPIDKFNEERDKRPNPFTKPVAPAVPGPGTSGIGALK